MHIYIQSSLHTYLHKYIHAYIMYAYIYITSTCMHKYTHAFKNGRDLHEGLFPSPVLCKGPCPCLNLYKKQAFRVSMTFHGFSSLPTVMKGLKCFKMALGNTSSKLNQVQQRFEGVLPSIQVITFGLLLAFLNTMQLPRLISNVLTKGVNFYKVYFFSQFSFNKNHTPSIDIVLSTCEDNHFWCSIQVNLFSVIPLDVSPFFFQL